MSHFTQIHSRRAAALDAADGPLESDSPQFRARFKGTAAWLDANAKTKAQIRERKARVLWAKLQAGKLAPGPGADGVRRDYAKEFARFAKEKA